MLAVLAVDENKLKEMEGCSIGKTLEDSGIALVKHCEIPDKLILPNVGDLDKFFVDRYTLCVSNGMYIFDGDLEELFDHSDIVLKGTKKMSDWKYDEEGNVSGVKEGTLLAIAYLEQYGKFFECKVYAKDSGCGLDYAMDLKNIFSLTYTWKDIIKINGEIYAEEFPISGEKDGNDNYQIDEFFDIISYKYGVNTDEVQTYVMDNIEFNPEVLPYGAESCGCYINGIPEWTIQNYVQCHTYTSTDWHDMASVVTQMKQDAHYEIDNPEDFIANDIFEHIKELIPSLTVEDIKAAMNAPDDGYFDINEVSRIEIFSKKHTGFGYQIHYDEFDYTYLRQYQIDTIKADNVVYLVSEHIVNPGKGCDLLERAYHDLFDNLSEAEKYQAEKMEDYKYEGSSYRKESGYKICVVDKSKFKNNPWYKDNMSALRLMEELGEDPATYRFYRSARAVVSELQQKKYEAANKEEKSAMDMEVYQYVREYLTDAQIEILDTEMGRATTDFSISSRAVADKAIILSFVNATSQMDYDAIHEKLGEYVSRIAQITEANVYEKRGHGKVCVSKNGEVGYYDNAFGINSWEGAKDNPFFGKFSPNMGGEVDQFEKFEYHHMFVDVLPTQELVDSYYKKYEEWEKKQEPFS